jgi:hypothetical protein
MSDPSETNPIAAPEPRRSYEAPHLIRLGSTRELTLGSGQSANEHPAAGKKKKVGTT